MLLPALITALYVSAIPCPADSSQAASSLAAPFSRTIDKVVVSVDGGAITLSDVETEYRVEVLLEESRVPLTPPDAETSARALERLIDQKLLLEEATADHTDRGGSQERAEQTLARLQGQFPSEGAFQSALRSAGLSQDDLLKRIEEQNRILRIVDQRMRPLASVGRDEIETYYQKTFLPEWADKSKDSAPTLADVEAQIQEILVQRKIDQQLEAWLKELRAAHRVRQIGSISSQ